MIVFILSCIAIFCGYSYMKYLDCDDGIQIEKDREFWTQYNKDREKYRYDFYRSPDYFRSSIIDKDIVRKD